LFNHPPAEAGGNLKEREKKKAPREHLGAF
jgi:hypothetical protein